MENLPSESKAPWPPAEWKAIYDLYALHDAWYSGDMERLANLYRLHLHSPLIPRSEFWAREQADERARILHLPLAGDIAATSSSWLFGEAPTVRLPNAVGEGATEEATRTQARLQEILDANNWHAQLSEAAESASAMSGVFLRVGWDSELAPHPLIEVIQADNAIPFWKRGVLVACTFWEEVSRDDDADVVWRKLERHSRGYIETALYQGTHDHVGERRDLSAHPATTDIPDVVETKIDDLLCRYIPNTRPNRRARSSDLGQSDYTSIEALMDSLDEVYTGLLTDVRLGEGKVAAPEAYFDTDGGGNWSFNIDRRAIIALSVPGDSGASVEQQIKVLQFAIRAQEYITAGMELIRRAAQMAGYSPQSFGLDIDGAAESGTALRIRERKSFMTTSKKARYWRPALEDILHLCLQVDALHLGNPGNIVPDRPTVEMQDGVTESTAEVAQTVSLLAAAGAASVYELVRMQHPDWADEDVDAEVQRIRDDSAQTAPPDPLQAGEMP